MTREKWLIFKPTTGTSIDYGLIKVRQPPAAALRRGSATVDSSWLRG